VIATAGFTGSLLGTASYATQALSASYAPSAGGAAFPFTGSALITGSLEITGSTSIQGTLNQGSASLASGLFSHAQGIAVTASGIYSHAEGGSTSATGDYSHAEGSSTIASGNSSHAEGIGATALGDYSHAEGYNTKSSGSYSHAEGAGTLATGEASHAEGLATVASGDYSHAEGLATVASGSYQHVQGRFNQSSSAQSAFIVGNGTSNSSRSNLIFASGSQVQITGSVIATAGFTGSLQGTASYATQALSASYAPSTPAFPFTGSATILGSLIVKQNATTGSLNTSNRTLQDDRNKTTVDWNNWALYDSQPTSIISVEWYNRTLYSSTGYNSILWDNRILQDSTGVDSSNWENRTLNDDHGAAALSWDVYDKGFTIASNYYYRSEISLNDQGQFVDTPEATTSEPNYAGEVITGTIDDTVTGYDLVYLNTNGVWYPVTQATDQCTKLLGICLVVPTLLGQNPGPILLEGTITVLSTGATYNNSPIVNGLDHGLPIYIENSYGNLMTTTAPTNSGTYVRVLGHAYQQSATYPDYWIMKFRPSNDWITI
jgi:hypothetical protein